MLRWLYLGRLMVAAAIFIAATLATTAHINTLQADILIASIILVSAFGMTFFGWWWTSILRRPPGSNFLYFQLL
jgi:hypothetical protein